VVPGLVFTDIVASAGRDPLHVAFEMNVFRLQFH
jgi:hypothetical protein